MTRTWLIFLILCSAILAKNEASLRKEIAEQRAELKRIEKQKTGITDFLDGLYRESALVEDLVSALAARDSSLGSELSVLNDSLEIAQARLDSAQKKQSEAVRAMYMTGRGREVAFILGGDDFSEFARRVSLFRFLAKARSELSMDVAAKKQRVEELIDSTEAIRASVKATRKLKLAELDSLESLESRKKSTLEDIRRDERSYRKAIADMENSLAELKRRLPKPALAGNFARKKGKIRWPSKSRKIMHPFGIVKEKRFGTSFRNAGIDIATKPEEGVVAVADGRIAQIYWLRGYGRIVIVEHGGGYFSVYGNLGRVDVAVNQRVREGEAIGRTAADGWLEGSKLHFEIRNGRQEVNPLEWLVAA